MTLSPPEELLARLVRVPAGARAEESDAAAAATLAARGHALLASADGWRLECAREHFDPAAFETARAGAFGRPLEVWEATASTNDLARAAALAGAADGALWLAERQTRGRGRQGRSWECPAHAGLLVSFLVDARLDGGARPTLLPLAVGLGCCEALRAATGLDVRPKWPNDLWIDGRKLGGLLVETLGGASRVVVGLGLNVRRGSAPDPIRGATLEERGATVRREILLARLLAGVERRIEAWRCRAHARLRDDYAGLEITLGNPVRARIGEETVDGRATGLSDDGLLLLETASGAVRELAAGEVHLL
jgi:BirA family biotin operon repressor/biotin-[acetyl-CoA-carboxylase] ligase